MSFLQKKYCKFICSVAILGITTMAFGQDIGKSILTQDGAQDKTSKLGQEQKSISPKTELSSEGLGLGATHCMFSVVERKFLAIEITAYSTYGLNECNVPLYNQLTTASISAQLQTFMSPYIVAKNGIHTLVVSKDLSPTTEPFINIGAIQFKNVAVFKMNYLYYSYKYLTDKQFRNGISRSAYVPYKGKAPLIYLYNPGQTAYEILTPDGKIYIMTSFTNYYSPNLDLSNLKNLGSILQLPSGWKFRSIVLDKQISLTNRAPDYETTFMFDEFSNYYVEIK